MAKVTGSLTIDRGAGRKISRSNYNRDDDRERDRRERVRREKKNYGPIDSSTGGYAEYEGALNDAAKLNHRDVLEGKSYRDYEREEKRKEKNVNTALSNVPQKTNTVAMPLLNPSLGNNRQGSRISDSVQASKKLLGNPSGLFGKGLADIRKNSTPLDTTTPTHSLFRAKTNKFSPAGTPEEVDEWDKRKKLEFEVAKKWLNNNQAELVGNFVGNAFTSFSPPLVAIKNFGTAALNTALNYGITHTGGILKWAKERGQFDYLNPTEKEIANAYYKHLNDERESERKNRSIGEKALRLGGSFFPIFGQLGKAYADGQEIKQTLAKQNNPYIYNYLEEQAKATREGREEDEKQYREDRSNRNSVGILSAMKTYATTENQSQPAAYNNTYLIPGIANLWRLSIKGYDYSKYLNK
ncbi:MAG: hypothetical protein Q4A60_03390 [Pasteurellaceae bacterium]|nr:hypothetical protein [Pasteurellaceae bacterium]